MVYKVLTIALLSSVLIAVAIFQLRVVLNVPGLPIGDVALLGDVVSEPESAATPYGEVKTNFHFSPCGQNAKILVTVYGKIPNIELGDRIDIRGRISRPIGPSNPGEFNYKWYLKIHGVHYLLAAKGDSVKKLSGGGANTLLRFLPGIRKKIEALIYENLQRPYSAILSAMLLGERSQVPDDLNDAFMKTGTIHILAISGLHVGLITFLFLTLLKTLRSPRRLRYLLCILFLVFYAILVGARPSVLRASIMLILYLLGQLIGRQQSGLRTLAIAAVLILAFNPLAIFYCDFLLSFTSVLSILYFAPKIESALAGMWRFVKKPVSVSAAAWLGVLPLVAWFFNIITPVALLANLIIVPLAFLAIAQGVAFIILGLPLPILGKVFAASAQFSLYLLTAACKRFSELPCAYFWAKGPTLAETALCYVLLILWACRHRIKSPYLKPHIAALIVLNIFIWPMAFLSPSGNLSATFLSTGSSDAIFIEFPRGETMLIDTGKAIPDTGRMIIKPFLLHKGIHRLDALVLTHPDSDHIGGAATILNNFDVGRVFDNGRCDHTSACASLTGAIAKRRVKRAALRAGDEIRGFKDVRIFVLNPSGSSGSAASDNDESLVLKIIYKGTSFLFCADVEENGIRQLLLEKELLRSSIIKMPHHGARVNGIEELLKFVRPRFACITVARNDKLKRPNGKLLEILKGAGTRVLATSRSGAVTISTDGKRISVDEFLKNADKF